MSVATLKVSTISAVQDAPPSILSAVQAVGEPWVRELETLEYGALPLPTRLGILGALVQLALDGPSVRAALEAKLEEAARVRKAMAEDAKVGSCSSPCRAG